MNTLSITLYPETILRKRAQEVSSSTHEIKNLISQMVETMYASKGIGLAAPQVGISERIIIVETSDNPRDTVREEEGRPRTSTSAVRGKPLAFLNPRIVKASKEQETGEEGCLSLPGIFLQVKRAKQVEVICQTPEGKEIKIQASGLTARILQHEIDHINGVLIINRISPLKRIKMQKQLKELASHGRAR